MGRGYDWRTNLGKHRIRRLIDIAQVSAIGLLLVACSAGNTDTSRTETVVPVTQDVPSDWITYSDETAGFSISYPNDWEVFELDEAAVAEVLAGIEGAIGVSNAAIAVQAGLPIPGGFSPNITIVIEALPTAMSVGQYTEAAKRGIGFVYSSYVSTGQVKTVVRDRDLVLVHGSYEISQLDPSFGGRFWMIQGYAVDGVTGWTVTCGRVEADASEPGPDLEECDTIVRTFELSNA